MIPFPTKYTPTASLRSCLQPYFSSRFSIIFPHRLSDSDAPSMGLELTSLFLFFFFSFFFFLFFSYLFFGGCIFEIIESICFYYFLKVGLLKSISLESSFSISKMINAFGKEELMAALGCNSSFHPAGYMCSCFQCPENSNVYGHRPWRQEPQPAQDFFFTKHQSHPTIHKILNAFVTCIPLPNKKIKLKKKKT